MKSFRTLVTVVLFLGLLPAHASTPDAKRGEFYGAKPVELPSWFKQTFLDLKEDVAEAAAAGKRLMIYFHQDGCPYCAELVNNNFTQKHIVDYLRENFVPIEINMWGDREVTGLDGRAFIEKTFAADMKVWFTPTLLFLDESGNKALRINGYYPPHQFMTALRYVAEKQENKISFSKYYEQLSPPPASGVLRDQPFFQKPPYDFAGAMGDKPVAVFFEQKDCAGCDRLHEKVFSQPATLKMVENFNVVRLDRWSDMPVVTPDGEKTTARAWADKLNVAYVPSAVLYDQRKEVIRMEGFLKAFHVQSVMDYVVSGEYQREPSLQRFIEARADHLREQGIDVDLWN